MQSWLSADTSTFHVKGIVGVYLDYNCNIDPDPVTPFMPSTLVQSTVQLFLSVPWTYDLLSSPFRILPGTPKDSLGSVLKTEQHQCETVPEIPGNLQPPWTQAGGVLTCCWREWGLPWAFVQGGWHRWHLRRKQHWLS